MKIAIPIWEGKVSPVLDTASRLLVLQLEGHEEKARFETHLHEHELPRKCVCIQGLGVDLVICGAVSDYFNRMLTAAGIEVIPWRSGETEDVLDAYLHGNLSDARFLMPGYRTDNPGEDGGTGSGGKSRKG
jgi:predicted Fe-Mo cluster-binding NifX family protein